MQEIFFLNLTSRKAKKKNVKEKTKIMDDGKKSLRKLILDVKKSEKVQ